MIRGIWEEELAVGKENMGDSPAARLPVDAEMEAEAYENFFFDKMMIHDSDAAHFLVHFPMNQEVLSWKANDEALLGQLVQILHHISALLKRN